MDTLGSGTYGKVTTDPENEDTVVKITDKYENEHKTHYCQQNVQEAVFLSQLSHPNIGQCVHAYVDADKISLKLKKYNRDLHDYIHGTSYVERMQKLGLIVYRLLLALQYIDNNGLIHGDLKPSNIMFDEKTDDVKLIDFGGISSFRLTDNHSCICTYEFRAPEAWKDEYSLDGRFDIWSLGVTIVYFIAKYYIAPFDRDESKYKEYFSAGKQVQLDKNLVATTDPELIELLQQMLVFDKHKRITARKLLTAKYFKKYKHKGDNMLGTKMAIVNMQLADFNKLDHMGSVRNKSVELCYKLCDKYGCMGCFLHTIKLYDMYICSGHGAVSTRKSNLILVSCFLISFILIIDQAMMIKDLVETVGLKSVTVDKVIVQTDKIMNDFSFKLYYETFDWEYLKDDLDINYERIKELALNPGHQKLTNKELYDVYCE
jgi:serine/threonine protein kinase